MGGNGGVKEIDYLWRTVLGKKKILKGISAGLSFVFFPSYAGERAVLPFSFVCL